MNEISSTTASDSTTPQNSQKSAVSKLLIASFTLLGLVILVTAYFVWQNYTLGNQIDVAKAEEQKYQSQIDILKSDPQVRAAEILANQKDSIAKSIEKSNAAKYVRELDQLHKDYGITFNGFSYSQNKVSTAVTSQK